MSVLASLTRRSALGLGLALATALAGTGAAAADPVNIGVAIPAATHGWAGGIIWWANEAKKELEKAHPGLKITIKTASGAPEQANQVQDLATVNKINTLVILPFESAPLTPPVAKIKKEGVYVTVVDRGLTDAGAQDAYIAGDNAALGRVSAEYFGKKYNCKGTIVVLRGIPTVIDNIRVDSFKEALKAYPDMKILDAQFGNWNRDDAYKVMQDFLTRFKSIDLVWASDDDMAIGVLKAIGQAKRTDIKEVLGGAGAKGMIKAVMDGSEPLIQADVTYSPKMIYDAIKLTAEARLKGQPLPATTTIPSELILKGNAKKFYFPNSPF
jgi:ribose transport system substrate-binding protein